MEVSRRLFLGGALALVAATQLPNVAFASAPVIYGDGYHDDTAGLQAAFDGKPFKVVGKGTYIVRKGGQVMLNGGTFKLTDTLHVRDTAFISGAHFDGRAIPKDRKCVLRVTGCPTTTTTLTGLYIEGFGGDYGVIVDG